jgi:hypothetical protein
MAAKPFPVVFRPGPPAAAAIWAAFALLLSLAIVVVTLTWAGVIGRGPGGQPEVLLIAFVPGLVVALLARPRPIGLDPAGLHFGSPDKGHLIAWSDIAGVKALPRHLIVPERIRIGLANTGAVPGWWARRRWGVRVLSAAELEVRLGLGQSSVEIAGEIRRFIDAYG